MAIRSLTSLLTKVCKMKLGDLYKLKQDKSGKWVIYQAGVYRPEKTASDGAHVAKLEAAQSGDSDAGANEDDSATQGAREA